MSRPHDAQSSRLYLEDFNDMRDSADRLTAERDRLKALNAELLAALNYAVEFSTEAAMHWDSDYDAKVGKYLLALSGSNKGYDKRTDALHAALAKHKGETE